MALPGLAWPGPAQPPMLVQLPHWSPTMRSVLPWGSGKINGVQDKRSKKLFVLLSCPDCNGQALAGRRGILPARLRLAGSLYTQVPGLSHHLDHTQPPQLLCARSTFQNLDLSS